MTLPVTINFPAGLRPDQYSDIVAVSEDRPTARVFWLQGDLGKARAALYVAAEAAGMAPTEIYHALTSDDHEDGNNYAALLECIKARTAKEA